MAKPSRRPIMDDSCDKVADIVERVKELRTKPQTEKVQEEIKRLIQEWRKTCPGWKK